MVDGEDELVGGGGVLGSLQSGNGAGSSYWKLDWAVESSFKTILFLSFILFPRRGSESGRLFFVASTSILKVDPLRLSDGRGGNFSTSSFSDLSLLCFCVF